ncbi:MAG: hypothetical protein LBS90_04320 [Oscillospiraceae bacterium]|jgi:bifunctional UDP-N-acetylglucosamine pyrophosphorylase/glucosamine-1-phosphate N-acetyltransferase|nr:hypothetical protein [Oscillospiraceae bacterium]
MSLNLGYYFEHPDKCAVPELLAGVTYTYELLARLKTLLDEEYPGGYVDPTAKIGAHAVIAGCVYVGANAEIGAHAYVRPYSVIGKNCVVGHGSEVKRTLMFDGAKIASLAFVGDSLLGAGARIGSGVITANRRFDQGDISLKLDGEKHSLGSDFFGLVLGDSSRLGANCTPQPGTHVGRYTRVFPQTAIRGFVPSYKRVWEKRELEFSENEAVELK